jgi:hypothetical protein
VHPGAGEGRNRLGKEGLGDLANVVEGRHAFLGHTVCLIESDLGRYAANGSGDRRDQHPVQDRDRLGASQDQRGSSALGGEIAPADVPPLHHGSSLTISPASFSAQAISSSVGGRRS